MTSHNVFPHRWLEDEPVSDRLYLPDLGPVYADLLNELIICISNTNFNMIEAAEYDNESIKDSQITNSTDTGKALIALLDQVEVLREKGMNDNQGISKELERLLGAEKAKRKTDNKQWQQKHNAQRLEIAKLKDALREKTRVHEEDLLRLQKSMDRKQQGFEQDITSAQQMMKIGKSASDEVIAQREEQIVLANEANKVLEARVISQQAFLAETVASIAMALDKEKMLRKSLVSELEREQTHERTQLETKITTLERRLEYAEKKASGSEDDDDWKSV